MRLTNNFRLNEFSCNDENKTQVPLDLMSEVRELANNLQIIRNNIEKPIYINSGYRTEEYNTKVGGRDSSYHLRAMAADIRVSGIKPKELYKIIENLIYEGYIKEGGLGLYDTFVHYDIRGFKARW